MEYAKWSTAIVNRVRDVVTALAHAPITIMPAHDIRPYSRSVIVESNYELLFIQDMCDRAVVGVYSQDHHGSDSFDLIYSTVHPDAVLDARRIVIRTEMFFNDSIAKITPLNNEYAIKIQFRSRRSMRRCILAYCFNTMDLHFDMDDNLFVMKSQLNDSIVKTICPIDLASLFITHAP